MSFLVSNASGSFGLFGIKSRYQGLFFSGDDKVFKTIAHFDVKGAPGAILNEFWKVSRNRDGVQESFWFAHRLPVFFYELSRSAKVDVLFDCKLNFDNRDWGRNYQFSFEDKALLVHFEKLNDSRETSGEEYDFWLALYGCDFEKIDKWEQQTYSFDELRNSPPFSRWVLRGCRASGSFVVAFSKSKDDALKLAKSSWKNRQMLAKEAEKFASNSISAGHVKNSDFRSAYECAQYSLVCLHSNNGLYAGLPWFHQRWARDELVCVKALLHSGQESLAKAVLFDWLDKLNNCKLPGALGENVADCWLFLRFEDYLPEMSRKEKEYLLEKLSAFLQRVESNLQDGLVINGAKETWMDSIDRSGARIEVQCLILSACRLSRLLGKEVPLEQTLKDNVKKAFWNGKHLSDGAGDQTVRPNVFIAAYAYPELLSKKDWIACFDFVLPKLWLDWGGLSTVDKSHSSFVKNHTGENSKSYHSGDSWFWINNLAGVVLFAFDKKKYKNYIQHILKASTREILEEGVIGHHAELSSASKLLSEGCLVQAWSSAMYIELIEELFR
ncbi:Amylo-alpha-1,6-glucosidase [uncultured archaeon]|nr:Amylo-alpha-1,6-glucosidase [uncultured archaeon]